MKPDITCLVLVAACAGPGSADRPSITVDLQGRPQVVEVRGLSRATLRRLQRLPPNDSAWSTVFAVRVEQGDADTGRTQPVIGRYVTSDSRVRFEPRFPFANGVSFRVDVDTAAMARPAGKTASTPLLTHRFALPSVERPRTTRVVAVHPSGARLPSNLLRWYVETSSPMEVGSALDHIHLMDESGREVRGAFLALDQELWDSERRRLTLLFDPGRVKRGVRTNLESGAPLVAGRRYRLTIDDGWTDGAGARLASGFEHPFEAVEADRRSPDPNRWRLTLPRAGTRAPLVVAFGEPLDHALASRLLTVLDPRGIPLQGSIALAEGDSVWTFTPERDWAEGAYTLRVGGALEDLAGNNVVRVFDVDRLIDSAGVDRDVTGASRDVRFRIASR
jgi:hypothetical protein